MVLLCGAMGFGFGVFRSRDLGLFLGGCIP